MIKKPFRSRQPFYPRKGPDSSVWGRVLPVIWRGFKGFCFALGLMVILSSLFFSVMATRFLQPPAAPDLPKKMVLYLELEGQIGEMDEPSDVLHPFAPVPPTLRQIVEGIDNAVHDKRVQGLYVRMDDVTLTLTQAQEIRAAVKRFKEAGKFTTIYSPSYGGSLGGLSRMYLAAAFDERWMQPLGVISMEGLRAEMPFVRSLLDKVGVMPNFFQREEYKTAYESFTNREMSKANRQTLEDIVGSIRAVVMADMPADLGLEPKAFSKLIDKGLLTAPEALQAGVITHADYADVLVDQIQENLLGDPDSTKPLFVTLGAYDADLYHKQSRHQDRKPIVALVYAVGPIIDNDETGRGGVAAADEIVPAIMDAVDDDRVKAILLRIDSPGGSPVASENILRALKKAKAKGKPVIVSMGSMAASGGYWIATAGDRIFAMPTTLTGSIGVVGGKFSAAQMWDKIGVSWDRSVKWGKNAGMWSFNEAFSPTQTERFEAMLDQVYNAFLERVADGRGMSMDDADTVARGRVWPGAMAVDKGLVDELGGLQDAVAYVAGLLELDSVDDLSLVQVPAPLSPLERLLELMSEQSLVFENLRLQGKVMSQFAPLVDTMQIMGADPVMAYEPLRLQ